LAAHVQHGFLSPVEEQAAVGDFHEQRTPRRMCDGVVADLAFDYDDVGLRLGIVVERERHLAPNRPAVAESPLEGSLDKKNRGGVRAVLRLANDEQAIEQLQPLACEHPELDEPVVFDPSPPPCLDVMLMMRAMGER